MAKKKEELKEEVVTETTKKVEEPKEEVVEEKTETTVEDAKVEENASNENEEAEVQLAEKTEKVPTVREVFRDKYDSKVVYNIGDTFVLDESLKDNKPVKARDKQYKVSKARYEELKRCLYVD